MMKVGDVLLSVNGVSLTLGGKLVLRDLSLEIERVNPAHESGRDTT